MEQTDVSMNGEELRQGEKAAITKATAFSQRSLQDWDIALKDLQRRQNTTNI